MNNSWLHLKKNWRPFWTRLDVFLPSSFQTLQDRNSKGRVFHGTSSDMLSNESAKNTFSSPEESLNQVRFTYQSFVFVPMSPKREVRLGKNGYITHSIHERHYYSFCKLGDTLLLTCSIFISANPFIKSKKQKEQEESSPSIMRKRKKERVCCLSFIFCIFLR